MEPPMLQLPTVQLIGAQKSGTSAIADWLFERGGYCRPKVFHNEPWYYGKEVHFFDLHHRYRQGVGFYADRYKESKSPSRTLDATPDTLPFADRVKQTYDAAGGNQTKDLKVLVILRDPISRELSLYNHLAHDCRMLPSDELSSWHNQVTKDDGSIMSFDEFVFTRSLPALQCDTDGIGQSTRHGMYAHHLGRWFQLFDREQILVLSYDELQHNPQRLLQRIQLFLKIKTVVDDGPLQRCNANESMEKVRHISCVSSTALYQVFQPWNQSLYELLRNNPGPTIEERPFPEFTKHSEEYEHN